MTANTASPLEFHPVAGLFPLMSGPEFEDLKADIAANGVREPIYLYGNTIIDGRSRYRACLELGIDPPTRTWNAKGSLVAFVVSLNLRRRHLTSSQRACVAVEIEPALAVEAKERQRHHAGTAPGRSRQITPDRIVGSVSGEAREEAAKLAGTSASYVTDAKRVKKNNPELFEQVRSGEVTLPEAKRRIRRSELVQRIINLPTDKYRVVYADPPWSYEYERPGHGAASDHYPTLSVDEIKNLRDSVGTPVNEVAASNAVLFLWTTSALLPEALAVISAWGFTYKSSLVWDKVRHNFGYYVSVRHELLLIATRGACTPDSNKLHDSVVTIERTPRHSEKPERFREIIDTMYPHGKRMELFARKRVPGWDVWGNEVPCEGDCEVGAA